MSDKMNLFGNGTIAIEDAKQWKVVNKAGKFLWIDKSKLSVDHEYQRDNVNDVRVNKIAANWNWVAFGVLTVAERPDKTYWVVDGQHRKLAADKRTSVTNLPCMVFRMVEKLEEAHGFLDANTLRGTVSAYDKFRCKLACKEPAALSVKAMVDHSGYKITRGGTERNGVTCVARLTRCYDADPSVSERIWTLCTRICGGEGMIEDLFMGAFTLECKLSKSGTSLLDRHHAEKLIEVGQADILKKMRDLKIALGKGGPKVCAQAIVLVLNKSKKTNKIPDIMRTMSSAD